MNKFENQDEVGKVRVKYKRQTFVEENIETWIHQ